MMRTLQYAFEEAIGSLWRGRQAGLLSTATIGLALFVLGAFWLVTSNIERLAAELSRTAEMSIYLADDATAEQRQAIEEAFTSSGVAAGFEYVSKDEALRRFRQTFADVAPVVATLGDNPLPASYEVRLAAEAGANAALDGVGRRLRAMPGVADVRYDREWLDRLLTAVAVVRTAGVVLGIVLTLAAALTVANVVRLALYARRDEIEIMQLVGAPPAYIRGPFVMEGVLQGGAGALVSLAVLAALYVGLRGRYLMPLAEAINLSAVRFLSPGLCAALLVGGMVVGCIGGLIAASARTAS
jgi:cell division transport system permease protein